MIIEGIGTLVPVVPGHVPLQYTCSACGSFYGQGTTIEQVATLLNASATTPGVLHVGRHFIHCNEPMTETGEAHSRLARPAGSQHGRSAAISIHTRLLKCHCGFQLDVPR